jgi:hypothetical protein
VSAGGDTRDALRGWWVGVVAVARLGGQCDDNNDSWCGCGMHSDGEFFPHRLTRGPHCSKRCFGREE